MSGIFRSNSTSSHTNESTPNKRFSFSAFCSSPGTLQDVTMDNPYGVGYRSPCVSLQPYHGSTSPAVQGRSVREFEEQMVALRKENFNLKLRLYFVEESIPGYHQAANSADGQETLRKQLIDVKVEAEVLRNDLKEKQAVLKDAAVALDKLTTAQQEAEMKYEEMLQELRQKLDSYERRSGMETSQSSGENLSQLLGHSDVAENLNAMKRISELEGLLTQSEQKILDFQSQISQLDELLAKRDETIGEYEDKVKELAFQNAELVESAENQAKDAANKERSLRGLRSANAQLKTENEQLNKALKLAQDNLHKEMTNAKMCEKTLRDQQDVLQKMQKQLKEKVHKCKADIADKECTIMDLEDQLDKYKDEIRKKTSNLQTLVNKELWEKNREIERLNKILNNTNSFTSPPTTNNTQETAALQCSGAERNSDALISQLHIELKNAHDETATARKLGKEWADLYSVLSTRLEELAGFLNSLLRNKDILGFLAVDKRKAIRSAVDRSLDLSRNLSLSMVDHSLVELTNLSGILADCEVNNTFNSHVEHAEAGQQCLETLKAENKALKRELDRRRRAEGKKERRSLPLSVMVENRESESEAWSEPDRNVSMARIGLEDHSASRLAAKEQPTVQHTESDSDYSESVQLDSRSAKTRKLEEVIQQRDNRILEIQCQLFDAENRAKAETSKVEQLTSELEKLKLRNTGLHNDLEAMLSADQSANPQNESIYDCLKRLQDDRVQLVVESRLAKTEIKSLKTAMEAMKQDHEVALTRAAEREKEQLSLVRQEMQEHFDKILQAKQDEYQETLQHHWVSKQQYEECKQQLVDLTRQYNEAQRSVDCLQENEQELKQSLVEYEKTTRHLQKEIDESTLRASNAVVARTKALNDKQELEKRLQQVTQQTKTYQEERDRWLERYQHLENEHKILMDRIKEADEAKAAAIQSGYTSEEVPMNTGSMSAIDEVAQLRMCENRVNNPSPDQGIDSDAGRVSSAELSNVERPQLKIVEMKNEDNLDGLENIRPLNLKKAAAAITTLPPTHDCLKVELEMVELRRKLMRTKRAFEDTYEKLRSSNRRKAQIEKDIRNQIVKTHNVLKNVRSNMENES